MNQTGPISIQATKAKSNEHAATEVQTTRRAATLDARPTKKDDAKSELMENSTTGTRWADRQKNDMINKVRGIKQSVSPDKY